MIHETNLELFDNSTLLLNEKLSYRTKNISMLPRARQSCWRSRYWVL